MAKPTGIPAPIPNIITFTDAHPIVAVSAIVLTVAAAAFIIWTACRIVRRALAGRQPEDVLTYVAAGIATAFSAQGMWRFFGDKLQIHNPVLRALLFTVFELAMLVCALRARRRTLDAAIGNAGAEGAAVWVMAGTSGTLSATDTGVFGGILARLAAPLVAAFLWERGMAIERRRAGRATINWRITPERLFVWLGLAESSARTASDVDAHRRLYRVARAAMRLRMRRASDAGDRRLGIAQWRLNRAMAAAVQHAGLAADPARQDALIAQIGALYNAAALADLTPDAPWDVPAEPSRLSIYRIQRPELALDGDNPIADLFPDTPATLVNWLGDQGVPDREVPVPGTIPDADEHRLRAAELFADEVRRGKVPGIRRIKRTLRVGQPKAQEVQEYLTVLATQ